MPGNSPNLSSLDRGDRFRISRAGAGHLLDPRSSQLASDYCGVYVIIMCASNAAGSEDLRLIPRNQLTHLRRCGITYKDRELMLGSARRHPGLESIRVIRTNKHCLCQASVASGVAFDIL
jgi:hypothetical protein